MIKRSEMNEWLHDMTQNGMMLVCRQRKKRDRNYSCDV